MTVLTATLTCPHCGHKKTETMPTNACVNFYECAACRTVGLPLLCGQVQRGTPASCEQQMTSHRSGPAVDATTHATPCANPAFCAITAPAVVTVGGAVSTSARESHVVGLGVSTLAPADPQAPLPPPPQA